MVEQYVMKLEDEEEDDSLNVKSIDEIDADSLEPYSFRQNTEKLASQSTQPPNVLDLSRGGKQSINVALQEYANSVFSIRVLILSGNNLSHLPLETFQLRHLTSLDLSDNNLKQLPNEIKNLLQLESLLVQGNELESLGGALQAPRLRTLSASKNLLFALTENTMSSDEEDLAVPVPLTNVDLRYNRLKGSITLGNYEHLVSLDVSHNAVEVLMLSALRGLQELRAAHNALQHLSVHGASLRILHAPHNQLETLASSISPINLVEIDVSFNKLRTLPIWLSGCPDLTTLHASNNDLTSLPEHLFCSELSSLTSLHLAHNKITKLPSMPRLRAPLKELLLHDNCISALPENFFSACDRLFKLNLSNNRLDRLPPARGSASHCLEKLYLTANCLVDSVVDVIIAFRSLRVLHISYNCLTSLPETCIEHWPELEELSISGNSLMRLPEVLPQLSYLKILRAHSNRLRLVPMFSSNPAIKILDLSHNELETIDLRFLAPKQLKYLDISCNKKTQVDLSQFHTFRSQRPMRFVDVSGLNGVSHIQRNGFDNEMTGENPWIVGFSECPDKYLELWSSQLRLPSFCNREGLFGIIDGEGDNEIPRILQHILPGLLLEEKSIKETANEYMKYVVLSAHRELKDMGQKKGACLILCHISPIVNKENGFVQPPKKYMLRLANVGDTRAVLCRRNGSVTLGSENDRRLGYTAQYPYKIPDPDIFQTVLKEDDEFIILGNKSFWKAIRVDTAVTEAKSEKDPIIAAKRLHDLAQSYGVEECISVIIIRFDSLRSDVDMLMRELRQTISTSRPGCRSDCCCSQVGSCCHSVSPIKPSSDRSSPSGQSDRPASEFNPQHYASVRSHNRASERRSCRGGVARAIRVRVEEEREEEKIKEEKPPSDEQFKCWEYMLEQNTQLLFDKELNTLTRGLKRENGSSLKNLRGLSGSSPQLHMGTRPARTSLPFLSKHFGSTRSFGTNLKPDFRLGSGRVPKTGPNAAYFGSLQRLMPYHLEYDFAVIQEKTSQSQDSLDLEGRMQQYWGVATTEL